MHYLNVAVVGLMSLAGLSTANMAGLHDGARRFNEMVARGDKETVTVTVTSTPESCIASTGLPSGSPAVPAAASPPVVIVPGTQSETVTYAMPSAGATITPGAPAPVVSSVKATASPSGSAPVFPVPVPVPASANATTGANIPIPVGTGSALKPTTGASSTSTAVESSTSTASETTTETSPRGTATATASSSVVHASSNSGNKSFAGIFGVVMAALTGSVALLF